MSSDGASPRAVTNPTPEFAPVTSAVLPLIGPVTQASLPKGIVIPGPLVSSALQGVLLREPCRLLMMTSAKRLCVASRIAIESLVQLPRSQGFESLPSARTTRSSYRHRWDAL